MDCFKNDDGDVLLILFSITSFYYLKIKKRRRRRYAIHPINRLRREKGFFNNLLKYMLVHHDHESFFIYTRMTPALFKNLLKLVGTKLEKNKTKNALSPAQRLLVTLHYLAEGCSMRELSWGHYIGHSTVCMIIHETLEVLWNVLQPIFLKPPTAAEFSEIEEGFLKRWNVPNCFGAADGKHINMQAPKQAASTYFNYKCHHSIVLMATCDAFYKFTMVDIGACGSNHDATVFKNSGFGHSLLNGSLDIPAAKYLPNTTIKLPYFLVADATFPLSQNIMRPYPGQNLPDHKRIFNYRLSRARRCIENTFGILAARWRILRKPIIADVTTVEKITMAVVVLHNYLQRSEQDIPEKERKYCPTGYVDTELESQSFRPGSWRVENHGRLRSVGRLGSNNSSFSVKENRDKLCDYFNSNNGAVRWQWDHVTIGSLPTIN